jgi:hypothetical protein
MRGSAPVSSGSSLYGLEELLVAIGVYVKLFYFALSVFTLSIKLWAAKVRIIYFLRLNSNSQSENSTGIGWDV